MPVSATGQIQPACVPLQRRPRAATAPPRSFITATDEDAEINWTFSLFLCLVLTGSLHPPPAQVLRSLPLCLAEASARFSALFLAVFLLLFVFSPSRSFLGFAWLFCLFFLLHRDTHFLSLSLSVCLSLSLCPFHLLLAQEENGDLERANTVALDLSSCCAILVVRISRCQPTECRVAKQSSRAAFILEQPLFPFLHNAPSEQQRQFGNESRLTLLLIQQGNVVGLFQ